MVVADNAIFIIVHRKRSRLGCLFLSWEGVAAVKRLVKQRDLGLVASISEI